MHLELPADHDPRRLAVRAWLAEHPNPTRADLAAGGYVAPHWPPPWGLGADAEHQLVIDEELRRAGVPPIGAAIGLGWAGPTILVGGTDAQRQRWLPGILDGSDEWAQLFSEPEAGSDLANVRTRAVLDGDRYVVDGAKIWTTWANRSRWGILLARTDPDAPKHKGLSYFVIDLASPGVEIRPIIEMTGGNHFNEVFLTEVAIPIDHRIGAEGDGWRLATVTLMNERLSLSEGGVLWGMGPTSQECLDEARAPGPITDPLRRAAFADLWTDHTVLRLLGLQITAAALEGRDANALASVRKALADEHGQGLMALVHAGRGAHGMLGEQHLDAEHTDPWTWGYLFSRALTIGGGTAQVQRNIIGERLLGLPREPGPRG